MTELDTYIEKLLYDANTRKPSKNEVKSIMEIYCNLSRSNKKRALKHDHSCINEYLGQYNLNKILEREVAPNNINLYYKVIIELLKRNILSMKINQKLSYRYLNFKNLEFIKYLESINYDLSSTIPDFRFKKEAMYMLKNIIYTRESVIDIISLLLHQTYNNTHEFIMELEKKYDIYSLLMTNIEDLYNNVDIDFESFGESDYMFDFSVSLFTKAILIGFNKNKLYDEFDNFIPTDFDIEQKQKDKIKSAISKGILESGIKKLKKSQRKIKILNIIKDALNDPRPGTMVWAENMGKLYKNIGNTPFKNVNNCMTTNFTIDAGNVSKYSNDHLYFIAKGMELNPRKNMNKKELCMLIQHNIFPDYKTI
jgi:hypothetical protein